MKLSADDYRFAALERINDAQRLHNAGSFAASIYMSGVAVECTFRAYHARAGSVFDSKHDLRRLMKASGVLAFVREGEGRALGEDLGTLWSFWKNEVRYVPEHRLLKTYKSASLTNKKMGDQLKWASKQVYECSTRIVAMGELRWASGNGS